MEVVHSWLEEYVGKALPEAEELEKLLNFYAFEIEGVEVKGKETVIDVDILPNRGSDALCHRGVAREIATILDTELIRDPLLEKPQLPTTDKIKINIEDANACPRFTLSLITGIKVKESPKWLIERLEAIGQRPINNIVDATNYVMYALGQPMHAYDADKFSQKGQWQFDVRMAKESESVSLLAEGGKDEERVVELDGSELLIVNGETNTPVGLAGIKGGRFAELDDKTKNIIVEAANFDPATIRKTARRLGILTDASKRFENGPAKELAPYAQKEIIALIKDIAGGECEGVVDEYVEKFEPIKTTVRIKRVNELLGLSLSKEEVKNIITRTGSVVTEEGEGVISVVGPWERTDLNIEADYIEEVGRIHGLSNIESVVPEKVALAEVNPHQYYGDKVRTALIAAGFSEVITSSFLKKAKIQLQNALASDKSYIRNTIKKNITQVLDANYANLDLLGLSDIRVFEIGTVFEKTEKGVGEFTALTLGARTKGNGYNPNDDKVLQEGFRAVEEALGVEPDWQTEKGVAEVDLTALIATLPVPKEYESLKKKDPVTYQAFSSFPAVARDIALWVGEDETPESVLAVLKENAGELCVRQSLFDTFSKEGRTSYAFRLVFQDNNRTLTDIEVNKIMDRLNDAAKKQDWEVR